MPSFSALEPYGWSGRWEASWASAIEEWPGSVPGRVVRHDGMMVWVATPDGVDQLGLRPGMDAVAVGDWALVVGARVDAVLDRASLLRRQDPGSGEQLLAANVDLVVLVAGLDRPVKAGRIERAVTLAWDAGATPLVVLTKSDLFAGATEAAEALQAANPGVDAICVSALRAEGLDALRARLIGVSSVLVGESGAGKSTLLNALVGEEVALTGRVRAGDSKGRHTTTTRELHLLPARAEDGDGDDGDDGGGGGGGGGVIIDTPGIRAVGLWAEPAAVAATFPDVEAAAEGCRFRDCSHEQEPGCAARAAVATGDLPRQRLESWISMRREAEAAMVRADATARRRAGRRMARVVKDAQARKGRT